MKFEVTADRSTVYEVEADSREEAIDAMMAGDAKEVHGTTHDIRAVPLCPTDGCDHNVMVEQKGDESHAWKCAVCGYVYGSDDAAERAADDEYFRSGTRYPGQ